MSLRILVVEDHPVYAAGLLALFGSAEDLTVVAAVTDGAEAVALVTTQEVDVVVMDLNLPAMSGIEATSRICALPAAPPVLVVTMVDDDETVLAALLAGARGYVLKDATGEQISAAVRTVAEGGAVFGPGVATRVLTSGLGAANRSATVSDTSLDYGLTAREHEVLVRIADGASNARIARDLGLTVKTVQNYVSRILDKLQVSDRTQAALKTRDERGRT